MRSTARPSGGEATSKKSARQVDSIGLANIYSFSPLNAMRIRVGFGSSSLAWKGGRKESVAKMRSNKKNVLSSQLGRGSHPTAANFGENGQVVLMNSTATNTAPVMYSHELITECATTWSVICFLLSGSHFALYVAFALSKDESGRYDEPIPQVLCLALETLQFHSHGNKFRA